MQRMFSVEVYTLCTDTEEEEGSPRREIRKRKVRRRKPKDKTKKESAKYTKSTKSKPKKNATSRARSEERRIKTTIKKAQSRSFSICMHIDITSVLFQRIQMHSTWRELDTCLVVPLPFLQLSLRPNTLLPHDERT